MLKTFFQKCGQAVITSYNALQHVAKGYNGYGTQLATYKSHKFPETFFQKSGQAVITNYNAL